MDILLVNASRFALCGTEEPTETEETLTTDEHG
jgi:hypothetical protein